MDNNEDKDVSNPNTSRKRSYNQISQRNNEEIDQLFE